MSRPKKFLIVFVVVFAVITIIRETGTFHFNYYNSKIESQSKANWNDNGNTMSIFLKEDSNWQAHVSDPCNVGFDLRDCAVLVKYKAYTFGDTGNCDYVTVEIKKFSPGTIWTPLIKYSNFTVSATAHAYLETAKPEEGKLVKTSYQINGDLNYTGTVKIWGISSYLNAERVILRHVMQDLHKQVKDHLKTMKN